jgi:hypothetical protein
MQQQLPPPRAPLAEMFRQTALAAIVQFQWPNKSVLTQTPGATLNLLNANGLSGLSD